MTKEELVVKLFNIFFQFDNYAYSHPYIEFSNFDDTYFIKYGKMYDMTGLEFEHLVQLSELFGTQNIKVDNHIDYGCETCDYGSDYGYTIILKNPTEYVDLLKELNEEEFDDKRLSELGISCK